MSYDKFDEIFMFFLSINGPFVNKSLRKAIMPRSKMKNHYLKEKSVNSYNEYKI